MQFADGGLPPAAMRMENNQLGKFCLLQTHMKSKTDGMAVVKTTLELDVESIACAVEIERAEGDRLAGKGIGDVSQSFSLFLLAIGLGPDGYRGATKSEKKSVSRRFDSVRDAYLEGLQVACTVAGQSVNLTRAGKVRLTGSNEVGLPTTARQTLTVERCATLGEVTSELERRERAAVKARQWLQAQKLAMELAVKATQ